MAHDINKLLKLMVERKASDLHITAGAPVELRIDEKLIPVDDKVMSAEECKELIYSILSDIQKENFERDLELDMAFGIHNMGRFRVNVFKQRSSVGAAIRLIPNEIWTFEK